VGKDNQQVSPHKCMQDDDKMQERRRPPTPPPVPQPHIHPGGAENVQDAKRGAIPKHHQQKETDQQKENPQKSPIDDSRDKTPKTKPPQSNPAEGKTIPQDRHVATQNDVLTQHMQRIMGLMGKAFRETGETERHNAHQQLHDAIILAPLFVTIDDLPIRPEWKTKQAQDVFRSALYHRQRRLESKRQARTKNQPEKPEQGAPEQGRPTRSNTKAPDIPPTPPVPIERQSRKDPK
jgi:hypothetical protein